MLRSFLVFCAMALAGLFSGCGSYQLGTGSEPGFRTLYIAPVGNEAGIAQAVALYSSEIRSAFIRDGRISLVNTPEAADVVLTVDLRNYDRVATSARSDDTRLGRKFDLELRAFSTLHDNRTQKDLYTDREAQATRQIYTTSEPGSQISTQQQSEYDTHPLLAAALAKSIVHQVLDTW